jgi:hypothetical protein
VVHFSQCDTSQRVAGSIPAGVIEDHHGLTSSGRTMTPWSTQHLTEKSTRVISCGLKAADA